ncbi:MAG TPA: cytochrome ubiquinol oxidase subunit I [Thermoanaerobaculia bacterium]|nr:cytochrome ubiquinol oxidase subunit I [Thermoanaerobaculia bacterium]
MRFEMPKKLTAGMVIGLLVVAAVGLLLLVEGAQWMDSSLGYRGPLEAGPDTELETPRDRQLAREEAEAAEEAMGRELVEPEYREVPYVGSRTAIWVIAQLKLLFAAFVLAVPMFVLIIEFMGYRSGDKRYDRLAYEFTSLLSPAFAMTAGFGGVMTFMLIVLYPKFTSYLLGVFSPTLLPYFILLFAEAALFYTYYLTWGKIGPKKHLFLGLMLNLVGTALMFIANAWLTFMTSPAGISEKGAVISVWDAVNNYTWMPINIHRLIANVAFGGSIAAAYAAYQFLTAKTPAERAHYDWMGYIGNFVAVIGLLPLPFAGYWLASEIYAFNQTMGITMMGGAFSWLFIIQAILIGNLFLGINYYLWLGMGRVEGKKAGKPLIPVLLGVITLCFIVWATPRSPISTPEEMAAMGGSSHPVLQFLGVMSAKNTAVNLIILATFVSFLLYRRTGKRPTARWAKTGNLAQTAILLLGASIVLFFGIYGYFVEARVRIFFSIPMVLTVLFVMLIVTFIDVLLLRNSKETGETRWGNMPPRAQYVLIFLAVTFTWLMGLMGYVRSGLRQHWHVYGVIRDTSAGAYTPTLGYATKVVSVTVLIFFVLIGFIFWLASLAHKKKLHTKELVAETEATYEAEAAAAASSGGMLPEGAQRSRTDLDGGHDGEGGGR